MNLFSKDDFIFNVKSTLRSDYAVSLERAKPYELYNAISKVIMRVVGLYWTSDIESKRRRNAYYLSSEYLMGRALGNNLLNLQIYDTVRSALEEIGLDLNAIENVEQDPGLGNGGLGRLAACFLDSAATLGYPLNGYGIRYEYGIFAQDFDEQGAQVEKADNWLRYGDPWSIRRESERRIIRFSDQEVYAIPYDTPIIGYNSPVINTLRLWRSEPLEEFDFTLFNNQEYDAAMHEKNRAEDISRVLYPNDSRMEGKILRLKQQYFFVSASIQDLIGKHRFKHGTLSNFHEFNALQLNDTHPAVAVAELIRILMDEEKFSFSTSLEIAKKTFSYTNHTILSEALEKWDEELYRQKLPRIYEIICLINEHLVQELRNKKIPESQIDSMRILHHGMLHMAHLAIYGSRYVNGVAELHTHILKERELNNWYQVYPEKFQSKTNGITQRRWLLLSNPELAELISDTLGHSRWVTDLEELRFLERHSDDPRFREKFRYVKRKKKEQLTDLILEREGIRIHPDSIFDIQIKRLHEYKRQLLNAFAILDRYYTILDGNGDDFEPRTYFFGAKSAPGYRRAKGIIQFINQIAKKINEDPRIGGKIKVVFVTNYNVSYAQKLFPAADVSEQISTAGKEASGTGNMKFMLNGAPTLGTLDGANVEIVEEAGEENNFIFGHTFEELEELRKTYNPYEYYETVPGLKRVVDSLVDGTFNDGGSGVFREIYDSLLQNSWESADSYFVLADFESYREAQKKIDEAYRAADDWTKKCILNMSRAGKFSSDRTVHEYAKEIWFITPLGV